MITTTMSKKSTNALRESLIHRWSNKMKVVMIIILYNQIKIVPWESYYRPISVFAFYSLIF